MWLLNAFTFNIAFCILLLLNICMYTYDLQKKQKIILLVNNTNSGAHHVHLHHSENVKRLVSCGDSSEEKTWRENSVVLSALSAFLCLLPH